MNNSSPPSGQVCCPVCTLFLREGMTLQTHLYTHPIDQVIDALVRVSLNQAQAASVPLTGSHYTAITYQQFLSSTTSLPSVEPNLMLFNPSVVSQQFVETPPTPSPILQSPFQNVLRSSMSVLPYNYCTNNQQTSSNSPSISAGATGSTSSNNMISNNSNNKDIISLNEKNNDSNSNNNHIGRIENEEHDHRISDGFSVITQGCQEPPVISATVNENEVNQPQSENCRTECTETQPEDDYCPESPKSQRNSNDSDEEVEHEEERTEFVDTYVCCDNNIGTVISDSQRLIENDPNLEYDRDFRVESRFNEEQLMFDQQAPREETVSPVSSVSNWSSGSALRVRKDLNDNSHHSMFNYERTSADPLEISSDAFNDNGHRSTSGLLNLDTPLCTRGYSVNEHLEEPDYIENKDDNSDQSPPLNIHSDELMPPRGELSGQESLGATENSVWEIQAVREKSPEIPTSYQLLERGRWEVSVSSNNELSTAARPAEKRQTVIYKCLQCDESFKCPKERRVHVSSVHQNKRTQVKKEEPLRSLSPNKFDPLFVKQEVAGVKTEPNCKTCQDCGLELPTIKELKKHRKEQHQDKKANRICSTCNEYFPDTKLYRLHIAKVHPLECVDCGKCFLSRPNLTLHQKRHLKVKPYHCSVCDKSFVTRQKLAEHENGHSGNAPFKCTLCDRTFKRYSNLIQHKNCYHLKLKKKLKDFFCHCGEVFHSVKKLEWHKEIHEQKPKHCIYCSEKFIHNASLTRHIRRSHDSEYLPNTKVKMENVQCPICHQVYLKTSLASHMRHIHSGEKKFSCSTCAKEFSTKWNLHLHKWTHASRTSKPFKCKLCKAAFYHIKDYQAHNRSHRNIRPYTCNHCGQQFIRKYNCIRHVREHEVSKSFSCQVCGKLFHRSYYLTEHMRVHTGVKPYSCHICAKLSTTKSNHNKHVKTHHAREPLNTEG